jgi:hypothetical protein
MNFVGEIFFKLFARFELNKNSVFFDNRLNILIFF